MVYINMVYAKKKHENRMQYDVLIIELTFMIFDIYDID